jgi:hypothetical protein
MYIHRAGCSSVCSSSSRVSSIAQLDEVRDMFTLESCCPTASIIHTHTHREREGLCYIDMGVGYTFGRHGPVDETLWEVKLCLLALCAYRFLLCVDDERAQVCHVTMRKRSPIYVALLFLFHPRFLWRHAHCEIV